jgi:serine/threonine protein kinase
MSLTRSPGGADQSITGVRRVLLALEVEGIDDLQPISIGQRASVYRGIQTTIGREVVIKVLNDELTSESGQRFDRERTLTGQLSGHAGIVPLFDTGATTADAPYLVMPFYQRGSLTDLIDEHGPIGWREATFLIEPIAVTLAEVHSRGVIHRNLKPSTTLLTDFLLPRVTGFERALRTGDTPPASDLEATPFFSPTDAPTPTSPSEDVHALGALLWALLAGQAHFPPTRHPDLEGLDAPTATILARQCRLPAGIVPPPQPILDLAARAMSADLSRRPPNAAAFVTELRRTVAEVEQDPALHNTDDAHLPLTASTSLAATDQRQPDQRVSRVSCRSQDPLVEAARYLLEDASRKNGASTNATAKKRALSANITFLVAVACMSGIVLSLAAALLLTMA